MPNFETVDINLHFEQISVHIALLFRVMFWVIVADPSKIIGLNVKTFI
jgi:hypothetical protein